MYFEKSLCVKALWVQTVLLLPHLLKLVFTSLQTQTRVDISLALASNT